MRTVPTPAQKELLPDFVGGHVIYDATVYDESQGTSFTQDKEPVASIDEGNLISSKHPEPYGTQLHRPLIDLDVPAELVPSSTPGHAHLYIDTPMPWFKYRRLLEALYEGGVIQYGVYANALELEETTLRLPWINKDNPDDNKKQDPTQRKRRQIEAKIEQLQDELRKLDENVVW